MLADAYWRITIPQETLILADPARNLRNMRRALRRVTARGAQLVIFPAASLSGLSVGDLSLSADLLEASRRALDALAAEVQAADQTVLCSLPLALPDRVILALAVLRRDQVAAWISLPLGSEPYLRHFQEMSAPGWIEGKPLLPWTQALQLPELDTLPLKIVPDLQSLPAGQAVAELRGRLLLSFGLSPLPWNGEKALQERLHSLAAGAPAALAYLDPARGESAENAVARGFAAVWEADECLGRTAALAREDLLVDLDSRFIRREAAAAQPLPAYPGFAGKVFRLTDAETIADPAPGTTPDLAEGSKRAADSGRSGPGVTPAPSRASLAKPMPLARPLHPFPFLAAAGQEEESYTAALDMLAEGLAVRLRRLGQTRPILGISGGLDSCLSLLLIVRAMDALGREREEALAVGMPGPGSHSRTRNNARTLAEAAGVQFREIPLGESIPLHLKALGHDGKTADTAFENAQARERTQILMDLANLENGIVIGTGDLSEIALGWSTYNGDQMSMYSTNATVPKTLVRALCQFEAERLAKQDPLLSATILDILATPVSPELLPAESEQFSQTTEDILGPYELHDFFLWQLLKRHATAAEMLPLAVETFADRFAPKTIERTLRTFIRRFIRQQYKRMPSPDGASLGLLSLSPRGALQMPSDLSPDVFLGGLEAR